MSANQKPTTSIKAKNNGLIKTFLKQISLCCKEEHNLMISVFDLEKNKFLYGNDSFQNILGYKPKEIIRGGWEYWYSKISTSEVGNIKNKIDSWNQKVISEIRPKALSFSYHIKDVYNKWHWVSHELTFHQIKKNRIVLNYLHDISQKEQIEYFLGIKKQAPLANNDIAISKREKEVLLLISEGFSSKQIADELYISNHTAIAHRKNLIEKFNVKNTAQLIKEASKSILM
ncbi:LuxR C-terminal-related transcriptional regulator [Maribellus maritimus]|uniref:LuxR C-terminal-related transcriptional regulator n=1 Tax=Maribellus maritimus TaxID=2870838 RepID=UPI001EEAC553|nr:LuxR C-terminal-related transcriptional regulator [Maribellus maritimus]MCG6190384.1 LuxR C-terminal-related transcriptional regulator [Maribellus maritimus]